VKPWKRDLMYIREVGPDEPRFDAAVQHVWDELERVEREAEARKRLEAATAIGERYRDAKREALS